MNRSQGNRLLAWALAISLVVHAVFAIIVRNTAPVIAQETLHRVTIVVVKPPPAATPHPARGGSTHPSRAVARPLRQPSNSTTHISDVVPVTNGTPGPLAAGSPGPAGTPKPSCASPNVPARTVQAVTADFPENARQAGATGTTEVKVSLLASGTVAGIAVYASSGNTQLDQAAERAARQSTYSAELRNCEPVAGEYLFRVDFQ
jgi:TonB family protein